MIGIVSKSADDLGKSLRTRISLLSSYSMPFEMLLSSFFLENMTDEQ